MFIPWRQRRLFSSATALPWRLLFLVEPARAAAIPPRSGRDQNALSSHCGGLGMYDTSWLARATSNGFSFRCMTTASHYEKLSEENSASLAHDVLPQRIKVKRLDKTARNIMNILDKEAVEKVNAEKNIPDVRAGYIIELKVEAPENKGRISTIKGLVIGRKNAGISTSIRVRRMESNVGVETVFPLYSPNIKSLKVLEKRSVRRAKLFYIRDRPFNVALRELAQRTAKKKDMILKSSRTKQSKK